MKQSLQRFLTCLILCTAFCSTMWAQSLQEKIADRQQLTNIPTIYLTVPDAIGKDINSVLFKTGNVAEYHAATIEVVDNTGAISFTDDKLEIKVRGNETAKGDKKPYRLKFGKDEKDAAGNVTKSHKHDMLGSGYAKRNWVLLANQKDGTLLHNALAYHIGQAVGMEFCPGYKFADLVINGQYRGSYQISDHVEVGSHRIDVDEDTGMYLESTRGDMVEEPGVEAGALGISIKNPEYTETADIESLKAKVTNIFTKANTYMGVYSTPCDDELFCNPKTGWRSLFDEETLIKYYIGVNITGNHDGFMTVKMYCNEGEKLHFGPLWDFDTSYGQYDDGKTLCEDTQLGAPLFTNYANTIVKKDPVFVKKVHDKLHALIDEGLETKLLTAINTMANEVEPSYHLNRTIWTNNGADYSGQTSELKQYVSTHLSWLTETIDEKYEAMGGDNIVIPETPDNPEDDPEVGPALNTEYTVPDMGFNGGYNNYPIPASAFNSKATSALVTVSGAVYIKFVYRLNQWGYSQDALAEFPNKGNIPQTGTYLVEGDMLQRALKGELAVNCDGNSNIVVTVINYGSEEPVTPDNPTTRGQLTNLPTIYLDATTINGEWKEAAVEVFDKDNKLYQGTEWKKEGLSKKGNFVVSVQYQGSGADGAKNSYRLKFNDKINLLTADGSYKQWVLLANDDDPSMLNNALAKELGDAIGMPWTPGYQFVDLYVNDTYMGTYQVTDRVKAEEGRSLVAGGDKDLDWQVRFNDNSELFEDQTSDYISAGGINVIYKNPDPKDITADQLTALQADLRTYFNPLLSETATNEYSTFANNIDKQQFINWYIAQEILGVHKGFSSIEAYRSVTEGATDNLLHFGPLWDSEKGFGNTGSAPAINMNDLNTSGSHKGLMIEYASFDKMKKIINYLWTQEWFKAGVLAKWNELYSRSTTSGLAQTLKTKASTLAETLALSQAKNIEKWSNSLEYNSTSHLSHANYTAAVNVISTYIDTRFPYLDKKFNEMAVGACEHTFANNLYADNGDGTHSRKCDKCDFIEISEKVAHSYTAKNNHPYCATCGATETVSIEGSATDGTKVYKIYESEDKTVMTYITGESSYKPKKNKIYLCDEEIVGGNNLKNVAWVRSADTEYNANEIVFVDENYTYDQKASIHAKTATYTRSMTSTWGTLCLPFKVASCEDYTLYEISDTKINDDQTGTIVFNEIQTASGLQPVVFRKNTSASSVTFRGVAQTKTGPDNGLVTVKKSKKLGNSEAMFQKNIEGSGAWKLYGNVKKNNTTAEVSPDYSNVYYIASNKFWQGSADVKVATFRAVFVYTPEPGAENAAKSMSIAIGDNDATGIHNKVIDKNLAIFTGTGEVTLQSNYDARVYIYNVNGTKVANTNLKKDAQQRIALPKGVYIINGTKVVVK